MPDEVALLLAEEAACPEDCRRETLDALAAEHVHAGRMLDQTLTFVRRYVILTDEQAVAVALWIAHTHAFDAAETTPYLSITSAEKASGKTRLLEVLEKLVARPWLTGHVTAASLVRKVARDAPALLLDESDAAWAERDYAEALRGVLNSGYRRGGKASVCVKNGGDWDVRDFPTFCPKAIAGIGTLPDTVASRSIPIRLKRRAPAEHVERFRERDAADAAEPIYMELRSWAERSIDTLATARPAAGRSRSGGSS
jgi:hypothetical protein